MEPQHANTVQEDDSRDDLLVKALQDINGNMHTCMTEIRSLRQEVTAVKQNVSATQGDLELLRSKTTALAQPAAPWGSELRRRIEDTHNTMMVEDRRRLKNYIIAFDHHRTHSARPDYLQGACEQYHTACAQIP